MSELPVALGTIVEIPQGRGVVRFAGNTSFSTGLWIGIELYDPNGKNDGSVNAVPYFSCKMNYGVFVRPGLIKATYGLEPSRLPAPGVRPALSHHRTPSASGLLRTNSTRSNASSAGTSPRPTSPAKVPSTPQAPAPTTPAPPSTTRINRANQPSPTKRIPALSMQPRKSLSLRSPGETPSSPILSSPTQAARIPATQSFSSFTPTHKRTQSPMPTQPPRQTSPPPLPSLLSPASPRIPPSTPSQVFSLLAPASPKSASPIQASQSRPQDDSELQELRAKIRVLEAKRTDDSRHIRELEARISEAETFVSLRPKLQAKLNAQQTELIDTRRELADAQQLSQLSESRLADSQEQLEMTMLDKEVAEEKAELAESEVEELKEKLAVLEVEMNVLKQGGSADREGSEAIKNTLDYIQLEKQNERLKEALIKLKEVSSETEQEQRKRIMEMESDVNEFEQLQAQYEEALGKLANAEVQVEDLKLQLDDALGAEEMLVQLTERNLELGEKIEEMRITIEDLEALKELNDELEENHVETEKQLNEDLDVKEMQVREHVNKIEELEDTILDLDGTIGQFRELVTQLQNELEALRAQTQTAQSESATAASQTAAIMSINLKLQSTASKNQARNIDFEIMKLEAKESRELLGIVQPYLPQIYVENDSDATHCYLFFQRLACKADLINSVVAHSNNLPESLNGNVSEVLVGVCEMRSRIATLSTLCRRFSAVLRRCDVDSFLSMGRLYPEILPMEKRLDMHLNLLRRDEFREMECVSDIVKIQAQFDHIAETYFSGFDHDLGERELGYVMTLDHDLDMFAASIGLTKTSITSIVQDEDVVTELGGYDIESELFMPLQKLLEQCKSAKALSKKLTKRMEDLTHDNAALKAHLVPQMKGLTNFVEELVNFGISLAQQIMPHLSDARSAKSPFQLNAVLNLVKQIATSTVAKNLKPGVSVWEAVRGYISQLIAEIAKLLPLVMEPENVLKLSGTAPWVTRVEEIKANMAVNVEAERKAAQLNDEIQGLIRSLKTKDQAIQESTVKIELMGRRMEAVKKQADTILDLESELSKARKQERAYEEAMELLQSDLDVFEQENARLKAAGVGHERQTSQQTIEPENTTVEGNFETSYLLEQNHLLSLIRTAETDHDDARLATPPPRVSLRALATETKLLYRDVIQFSSSPRIVDLSVVNAKRAETKSGKMWMPKKKTPAHQVWQRKAEAERLSRRVRGLLDRADAISAIR
ncbi:dynactin [Amanita rubescens]|nr:dynactin [Amanita rubescens]